MSKEEQTHWFAYQREIHILKPKVLAASTDGRHNNKPHPKYICE